MKGRRGGQSPDEGAAEIACALRAIKFIKREKLRVIAGYSTTGFNPGHLVSRETADMSEYVH